MPSNNKNKGFAIPGKAGLRLAHASNVGALVRPLPNEMRQLTSFYSDDPRLPKVMAFLAELPTSGARVTCGQFALSERTHAIIERDTHFGAHSVLISPMVIVPEDCALVEVSVGWVEFDVLLRYSAGDELAKSRVPGVNTWSYIAEKCDVPRIDVKRAFFTALYNVRPSNDISMAWEKIVAGFPELRDLRESLKEGGGVYLHRRANDWRIDLYEKIFTTTDHPVVLVGPGGGDLYLEVPSADVEQVVTAVNALDKRITARAGTTLGDFRTVRTAA